MQTRAFLTSVVCLTGIVASAQQTATPAPATAQTSSPGRSTNLGTDPNGQSDPSGPEDGSRFELRREEGASKYTLPDPLVSSAGKPVRSAAVWMRERRPEIIKLYESSIFGAIPANTPNVTWQVTETDPGARDGKAVKKRIVGKVGTAADGPTINVTLYTPAHAGKPAPIILLVNFASSSTPPPATAGRAGAAPPPRTRSPVAAEILERGWGYAMVGYLDIQPDKMDTFNQGVIGTDARIGEDGTGPGGMGGHRRLGVGCQPDPRLPRDRSGRRQAAHRAVRALAARQDGAVGVCARRADCRRLRELFGRDGSGPVASRFWRDGR